MQEEQKKTDNHIKHQKHMSHKTQEEHHAHHQVKSQHEHGNHHAHMVKDFRTRFWISLAVSVPILLLSPMIQKFIGLHEAFRFPGDMYVLFGLSSFVFFYCGYPFLKGLFDELKKISPGMMTLIDIMLLGHWIEMKSVMGASRALEELAKLMPSEAHKIMEDGSIQDVSLDEIKEGDKILVKPGEKIPADGDIVQGETSVNEAILTGESKPVSKKAGSRVIGGAINGEGSITVEIKKTGKDFFLSQVIDLVRQAQESKSKTQDLANRAALWLTIIALSGGAITLFIWLALMQKDFAFALERTLSDLHA